MVVKLDENVKQEAVKYERITGLQFLQIINGGTGDVFGGFPIIPTAIEEKYLLILPEYILEDTEQDPQRDPIRIIRTPKTICQKYSGGYRIGIAEPDIELYAFGKSENEAYENFWQYLYELIPRLEEARSFGGLTAYMENILNYLLDYFYYSKSQGKTPYREPKRHGNRIILTADDRKYLNPKFPPEKELSKSDD